MKCCDWRHKAVRDSWENEVKREYYKETERARGWNQKLQPPTKINKDWDVDNRKEREMNAKFIMEFGREEQVKGMCTFQGKMYVVTTDRLYEIEPSYMDPEQLVVNVVRHGL